MWQSLKNVYHLIVAFLACLYYGFPARNLTVIGVTGTDGKTTTASIIHHILSSGGYNSSVITSVNAVIDGNEFDTGFHVTTPSSFSIQKFLYKASKTPLQKGKRFMVLEVTSHALDQHRTYGIDFEVSVITNITYEHLDYHKTYERYVKTKAKILKSAKKAYVINADDQSFKLLIENLPPLKNKKRITYGMGSNADINPANFPFKTKLIGLFNQYNSLAAVGVLKAVGLSDLEIRKGLSTVKAPRGREEVVYDKDFTVMIDFAHTPNSIGQILKTIHKTTKGRVIHVFGSAGKRDVNKRPFMGKESNKYADIIILTAEDPRSEPVEKINQDIKKGIKNVESKKKAGNLFEIPSRQEAINKAILFAQRGDTIIISGKGHEKSMNLGNGEEAWSDHEAVQRALELKTNL